MKTALKCTVIALTALSLVACGSSSNTKSRRHATQAVTTTPTGKTTIDLSSWIDDGWKAYSKYHYIVKAGATECDAGSSYAYTSLPDGSTCDATFSTSMMSDMTPEVAKPDYSNYINCVLTSTKDFHPGDLSDTFSSSNLSETEAIAQVHNCCSKENGLQNPMAIGVTASTQTMPANNYYEANFPETSELTTGQALVNYAHRELYEGYCYAINPEPITADPVPIT